MKSSLQTSSYHYLDSSGSAIQCMVGKRYSKIVTQVAIQNITKGNGIIFLSYLALLGVKHVQFARFVGHRDVPWCRHRLWFQQPGVPCLLPVGALLPSDVGSCFLLPTSPLEGGSMQPLIQESTCLPSGT